MSCGCRRPTSVITQGGAPVVTGTVLPADYTPPVPHRPEPSRPPERPAWPWILGGVALAALLGAVLWEAE